MKVVFNKLKIFSTNFSHSGREVGPIEMKLKPMEPQYIKNLGNWKPETKGELYLDKMPINIMKVMARASENHKVHYNPMTIHKPPRELQRLVFHLLSDAEIFSTVWMHLIQGQ